MENRKANQIHSDRFVLIKQKIDLLIALIRKHKNEILNSIFN